LNGEIPYGAEKGNGSVLRKTAKVGSFPPNAFGLYDMHGNVAEWCADWFDPEYYDNCPEEDPLGPPVGAVSDDYNNFFLVVRGGSWLDDARACRSAYRQRAMHRNKYWWIGFRVVAVSDE
jgi:formylglycine-generating enzyme required for sulfatase activity